MEQILELLAARGTGLFVTVDEVISRGKALDEVREIAQTYQHWVTEGRQVAIAFAGLPHEISAMEQTPGLTFIWRANRVWLDAVPIPEVRSAFEQTIVDNSRSATREVIREMAIATAGYPFLIQAVGANVWNQSTAKEITADDVKKGKELAKKQLGEVVFSVALRGLSPVDKMFLTEMAQDDEASILSELRTRLGDVSAQYINRYRSRLIDRGLIRATSRGSADFTLPYLREYLREHSDLLVWSEDA
jgi:hypothetical protein